MNNREIARGVYAVGAIDWERQLFDALIPLPDGTTYNAYLVRGSEKTALIDTVDPSMAEVLLSYLDGVERVDYVISQHAEQDHSGSIPILLEKYPGATLVTTPKGKSMLVDLMPIPEERIRAVDDGDSLSLGDRTLRFIHFPWVHWPETMLTYLPEEKLLFPCDLFGSHLASDELFAVDEARTLRAAKRYYAEIMMPLRGAIARSLPKLDGVEIAIIAPSHGPVYGRPALIQDAYRHWVAAEPTNAAALAYVSMHGSTQSMITYFGDALASKGIDTEVFDLSASDIGELAAALVDAPTLVMGTPTVLGGPHPYAMLGAYLVNALRPPVRYVSAIVSYGWGGKTVEKLTEVLSGLKVDLLDPVVCQGAPGEADFQALDALAVTILEKHKELKLL